MNFTIDVNTILQGIILLAIGAGVRGIFSMNKKIGEMNGSVRELVVWKEEHEKKDSERFGSIKDNFKAIWNKLNDRKVE